MIIDLCSALLHKLNKNLELLNSAPSIPIHLCSPLYQQVCQLNTFDEDLIMARIDKIYKSLNNSVVVPPTLVKLYHGNGEHTYGDTVTGAFVGLIGQNIIKPLVEDVEMHMRYECGCEVPEIPASLCVFGEDLTWVDESNINSFLESVRNSKHVLMHAYLHTYRTYLPFTCVFLVRTDCDTYVVDALKHKRLVAMLSYDCTYRKYMNGKTLLALREEFKVVPCCYSLVKVHECYFVDFRIRPMQDELLHLDITPEKDDEAVLESVKQTEERIGAQNNITGGKRKALDDILKLRDFVAKNNNESVNYVLTERQLSLILEKMPKTKIQFKSVLPRCSPILRAHIEDILFILNEVVDNDGTQPCSGVKDCSSRCTENGSSTIGGGNTAERKSDSADPAGHHGMAKEPDKGEQKLNDRLKRIELRSHSVNHLEIDSNIAKVKYHTFDYDKNVVEKVKNKFRRKKKD